MKLRKATVSEDLKIFVVSVLGLYLASLKLLKFWFLSKHSNNLRTFSLEFGEGEIQKGAAEYSRKEKQSCQPRMRLLTCIILYLLQVISSIQEFRLRGGAGFNNWEDGTLPGVVSAGELSNNC